VNDSTCALSLSAPVEAPMRHLEQLIAAASLTQVIGVAAELQLMDLIAGGANNTVAGLARSLSCSEDGLHRLLRALAGAGYVAQDADGRWQLLAPGAALCADSPSGNRHLAMWWSSQRWAAWGRLK